VPRPPMSRNCDLSLRAVLHLSNAWAAGVT
jgi:hypothetical protein